MIIFFFCHLICLWTFFAFQGFNERLVTASRPAIGVMFKQVSSINVFVAYIICFHWVQ